MTNQENSYKDKAKHVVGYSVLLVPWKLLQRLFYCFSCSVIG